MSGQLSEVSKAEVRRVIKDALDASTGLGCASPEQVAGLHESMDQWTEPEWIAMAMQLGILD